MLLCFAVHDSLLACGFFDRREVVDFFVGVMLLDTSVPCEAVSNEITIV